MIQRSQIGNEVQQGMRWFLLALFSLTGLVIILTLQLARWQFVHPSLSSLETWQYVFLAVLFATALISFLKKMRNRVLWEIVFTLTVFLGTWYVFLLTLPVEVALIAASILTLASIFLRQVWTQNLLYLLGTAGVAIDLAGWLSPEVLMALLVVMTVYDMVAGPPGGPIEELAKSLVSKGIIPGFIVVSRWKDLGASLDDVVRTKFVDSGHPTKSDVVGALLGAGDMIIPMCLVARAAFAGSWQGLVVLAGTLLGAYVLGEAQPTHPRAALPALAIGAIIPFLLLRFLSLV